ncbi:MULTISPECIES: replication/maintenance protein RepL [Acetobacter]|uniref:replication/maintenance protein RepL n=1 Tax=Acetobacter TaxID=434 RepID=UPI000384247D|nr:replication/maintenance protein RepL [Acetobacter pasteurianus]CCT61057.1 plasmid replication protein [Acetobacter pasteurianus 386B]
MATLFNGQRRLLDAETGEIIDAQVVTKTVGDAGFHKIWLAEILELVDEVGNAKMKILMWLLSKADHQNQVVATWQEIAEATGTSRPTVARLMGALRKAEVISEIRRSHWRLNPNIIFKGDHRQRMNVLVKYRTESTQADMFDLEAKRTAKKDAA